MPEPDTAPSHEPGMQNPGHEETALLHDLVRWRDQLARSIARNNLAMRSGEIAAAANRILFPLLFIAAAEDRGLLPSGILSLLRDGRNGPDLYVITGPLADGMYEGIAPETFRSSLQPEHPVIDDRVLLAILTGLTSPERRYDLNRMSAISLGQVLTPYLARMVRRSAAHHAGIVDTHDTVLSGGTVIPPHILACTMVDQALDAVRKDRSKREILPIRVLDPACGSGTLLVAAYRHLLGTGKGPVPSFEDRREILTGSIHGVDISPDAVAATRMLLVFELLKNHRPCEEYGGFLSLVLPLFQDLRHAVLCGNALTGPDISCDESWNFCPHHKRQALNLFSWEDHFTEVRATGGFDLVICNPPEGPVDAHEWIQQYFQRRYSVYHSAADRSAYFLEKGLSLLRPDGTLAFVMQSRWLRGSAGSSLRNFLKTRRIMEIAEYPGTGLCTIRIRKARPAGPFTVVKAEIAETRDGSGRIELLERFPAGMAAAGEGGWNFRDTRNAATLERILERGTPVADFCMGESGHGSLGQADERLFISREKRDRLVKKDRRVNDLLRPFIHGRDIGRYRVKRSGKYFLLMPPPQSATQADENSLRPRSHDLELVAARLLRALGPEPASIARSKTSEDESGCRDVFLSKYEAKILFPRQSIVPVFVADDGRSLIDRETGYLVTGSLFLLAVLNSRLARFWFLHRQQPGDDRKSRDTATAVAGFFIHVPDLDDDSEADRQARIESLARRMLVYHDQLAFAIDEPAREIFQKKIERTDRQIDALVYELYGLTAEEIAVVEESSQ
jgi:SAM-dependent methyltransferase